MISFIELCECIWLTISLVILLAQNIAWLWHNFKCANITYCSNRTCKYKNHCFRYRICITKEKPPKSID